MTILSCTGFNSTSEACTHPSASFGRIGSRIRTQSMPASSVRSPVTSIARASPTGLRVSKVQVGRASGAQRFQMSRSCWIDLAASVPFGSCSWVAGAVGVGLGATHDRGGGGDRQRWRLRMGARGGEDGQNGHDGKEPAGHGLHYRQETPMVDR